MDVSSVINDISNKPIGINVNYLMDDKYLSTAKNITQSLLDLGVKYLRYPGGEKSDNYLWSVSPWTSIMPKYARIGCLEWPSGDSRFSDGCTNPKSLTMDFEEFMSVCKETNSLPVIVVPYDCIFKPPTPGGAVITLSDALINAEQWVRYANIIKDYKIKYWMIGNETWNTSSYNGYTNASQYKADLAQFALRMKAVDPTIKIVANGNSLSWFQTILSNGGSSMIDMLAVSNYPVWQWYGGYEYYRTNTPNLTGSVDIAITAIQNYADSVDKNRIKVITAEFNSMDWSGYWMDRNDLGHALVTFEILGELLKKPQVEFSCFWNTRWINNENNNDIYDALDKYGNLNANGKALSIWGKYIEKYMVSSTSTTTIRTFASFNPSTNRLLIYIINKDTKSQQIDINLQNYQNNAKGNRFELSGYGHDDVSPVWRIIGEINVSNNVLSITLPAVSITLLDLNSNFTQTATNTSIRTITQTISMTVTNTRTRTPTWTSTVSFTETQTNSSTPSATMSPYGNWTNTPATNTYTGTSTLIATLTWTQTVTNTNANTLTSTFTLTGTNTLTVTFTITATRTITFTSTFTQSYTNTSTNTLTATATQTFTRTTTATFTETATSSNTQMITNTFTGTATWTASLTNTGTDTSTHTRTMTQTFTLTFTNTATETRTNTRTETMTKTMTKTETPTLISTATETTTMTVYVPPYTYTQTATLSNTITPTETKTMTYTYTSTNTVTFTYTYTGTITETPQPTKTQTPIQTQESNQLTIENLIIYPNPYNPEIRDLKIRCDITKPVEKIMVDIYTSAFRKISRLEYEGQNFAGTINIERRKLKELANGTYIIMIAVKSKEIEIRGKAKVLVIR